MEIHPVQKKQNSPGISDPHSETPENEQRKDGFADLKFRIPVLDFFFTSGDEEETAYAGKQDGRDIRTGEDSPDGGGHLQDPFILRQTESIRRRKTQKGREIPAFQNRTLFPQKTERCGFQNRKTPG